MASEDAVAYWIRGQRSREAAEAVLGSFAGVLMSDGYAVYEAVARGAPGITSAHCWAHVRRKFIEAESSFPEACSKAIGLIGALYEVEREVPTAAPGCSGGGSCRGIGAAREAAQRALAEDHR